MFTINASVVWDGHEPSHVEFRAKELNLAQNAAEAMFRAIIRDTADSEGLLIAFLTGQLNLKIDSTGSYNSARILVLKKNQIQGNQEALHICDVMLRATIPAPTNPPRPETDREFA